MVKAIAKLALQGNGLAVTIPWEMLDAAGLRQGDELSLLAREDGVIEISLAAPGKAELEDGFDWSFGPYSQVYTALSK